MRLVQCNYTIFTTGNINCFTDNRNFCTFITKVFCICFFVCINRPTTRNIDIGIFITNIHLSTVICGKAQIRTGNSNLRCIITAKIKINTFIKKHTVLVTSNIDIFGGIAISLRRCQLAINTNISTGNRSGSVLRYRSQINAICQPSATQDSAGCDRIRRCGNCPQSKQP